MPSVQRYLGHRTSWTVRGGAAAIAAHPSHTTKRNTSYRKVKPKFQERSDKQRLADLVPNRITVRSPFKPAIRREDVKYSMFERVTEKELSSLLNSLQSQEEKLLAWGIETAEARQSTFSAFISKLEDSFEKARKGIIKNDSLFESLRRAYINGDVKGLRRKIEHELASHAINSKFSTDDVTNQRQLADIRFPTEWFPATRAMHRTIHLHVGPTNSGKTYHALKRLEGAKTGIYAGPLRLLAHEVYSRMNAANKKCALITGEERKLPENMTDFMCSCTVEMAPINREVDVAVIDEIQMIGDSRRGWAWTQALMGLKAKEVHLCGEIRTVNLIRDICNAMGEKLIVHEYQRLSPLKPAHGSLHGRLNSLEKGDAVIAFSRLEIHFRKKEIETLTGRRCAVVYGSLPPDVRAQQAALFNDPDNDYDFLVASDAVGMGLNLSIKRIIFTSIEKSNGVEFNDLSIPEIKQIGGRAGRYKVPMPTKSASETSQNGAQTSSGSVGIVTTLQQRDFAKVRTALKKDPGPLMTAGLYPPNQVLERFAAYFPPSVPFSYIMMRFRDIARMHPRYHFCEVDDQVAIADAIQDIKLSFTERLIFSVSPCSLRDTGVPQALRAFARAVSTGTGGDLLAIKEVKLELLDEVEMAASPIRFLQGLESLHKILTLYLWLSFRFAGIFTSQRLAAHVHKLVESKIDLCLSSLRFTSEITEKREKFKAKIHSRASQRRKIVDAPGGSETAPEPSDDDELVDTVEDYAVVEGKDDKQPGRQESRTGSTTLPPIPSKLNGSQRGQQSA